MRSWSEIGEKATKVYPFWGRMDIFDEILVGNCRKNDRGVQNDQGVLLREGLE